MLDWGKVWIVKAGKPPECAVPVRGGVSVGTGQRGVQETSAWLSGRHKNLSVNFSGGDPLVVDKFTQTVDSVLNDIPALRSEIKLVGLSRVSNGFAQYDYNRLSLSINRNTAGKMAAKHLKEMQLAGRKGFLLMPLGKEYEAMVSHEMGHALTTVLQKNPNTRQAAIAMLNGPAPKGISEYAASNIQEGIAEAFAQMRTIPKGEWAPFTEELSKLVGRL